MEFVFAVSFTLVCTAFQPFFQALEKLPSPDFGNKVNYVAWLRQQFACDSKENARNEYSVFFQKDTDSVPNFLRPSEKIVREQIENILLAPRLWGIEEFKELDEYLAGLAPFIAAYEAGTKRRCFSIDIDERVKYLLDVQLPHLGNSKVITQAIITLAWRKGENEGFDSNSFMRRLEAVLGHSNHMNQGFSLSEKLVAIYERGLLYKTILAAVDQNFLSVSNIAEIKVLMQQNDSNDIRCGLPPGVMVEQALAFDLLQDMAQPQIPLLWPRPVWNKNRVLHWLTIFGRLDHPARPVPIKTLLSENPLTIAREIESYYAECSRLLEVRRGGNCVDDLRKLHGTYSSKHCYFQLFPLTDFSKVYQEALQVERNRRLTHLVICLLIHHQKNEVFPADFSFLGNGEDETITTDPITGARFAYRSVEKVAEISSPEVGVFKSLTIKLR
jgi:hypothetical protein